MQTCLQLQWLLAGECAARHTYISKYATAIHQNVALPRCHSICGKQRAAEYTQEPKQCKLVCNCNGFSQLRVPQGNRISPNRMRSGNVECSAEALQYMRQALRCRIYADIQASEPRQNPKNPLQFIEKLSITRIQQASPLVQIQR